jgi:23S rRNA (cytidine2498-2'-O)-methyltransferase
VGSARAGEGETPTFVFATCQVGAERALKAEVAREHPELRFAFSRGGFLTFKLPVGRAVPRDFKLRSVFARTQGLSLGSVTVHSVEEGAGAVWRLADQRPYEALHVWQRDMAPVGYRGFEPHITPTALAAEEAIAQCAASSGARPLARVAEPGQLVLDCVLVEPHQWWAGSHRAADDDDSCYAGGLRGTAAPDEAVSRAYVKMEEALGWSRLPIQAGQVFAEIGCSPGGASECLLDRGLTVLGIDPAQVDPRVLAHPNFKHLKMRGADVRRREFRGVTWLAADMNVAPRYTLDTVEAIVTHPSVRVRGLLLTLKLLTWSLAAEIPAYLARVRSWGYGHVAARQLPHNRREICVAALRRKRARC